MTAVRMKCGCSAQGTCSQKDGVKIGPPIPACIVHECYEVDDAPPSLEGRRARCAYFGKGGFRHYECNYRETTGCTPKRCACELPSDSALPFFAYQGPGSENATRRCKHCGFFDSAHEKKGARGCRHFEPVGDTFDKFFCGCAGWD